MGYNFGVMKNLEIAGLALLSSVLPLTAASAPVCVHPRLTILQLVDSTDNHDELVFEKEYLLSANEQTFDVEAPAVFWEDSLTGEGRAYFRQAPLPHARPVRKPDFRVDARRGITVLPSDWPCVEVPYTGGAWGRVRAMTDFQRKLRPYVSGRDGVFLTNTWGDGHRDACINEAFLEREIAAGAALGVDVIQIDDGWQAGRSVNSSAKKKGETGSWASFWRDPHFWDVDPVRFPHGLEPLVAAAKAKGMKFGLWFGPDSSNEAQFWQKDADFLLGLHRRLGIDYFKLDSLKSATPLALSRQQQLMRKLIQDSDARITIDLDVTAGIRPGYYGFPEIGPVFVENRYIRANERRLWWPHHTLRNFWSLAHYVDPARLRMEVLNPRRLPKLYPVRDPLAPANWPDDAIFAISMLASPLGWFEIQNLSPETAKAWRPLIATWKQHRDAMHAGYIYPVGARPDGLSWTGFVAAAKDGTHGYALLFRELADDSSYTLDLRALLPQMKSVKVLGGRGTGSVAGSRLVVEVPRPLDFIWVELAR